MIDVPRELVWDYPEPPGDELWRLQRLVDFFPHYGRDRETVRALMRRRADLRMATETKLLLEIYARRFGVIHDAL
jgi:hypothetical protein